METRTSLFLSFSLHIILFVCFYLWNWKTDANNTLVRLQWSKGQIPSLFFHLAHNQGEGNVDAASSGLAGTPEAEIEKFQNEIHFPAEALEQRLESDCTWELEIGPNGIAKKIKTLKSCKYPIFESHFRRAVSSWKFQLPEGKVIIIPVSFRIESND